MVDNAALPIDEGAVAVEGEPVEFLPSDCLAASQNHLTLDDSSASVTAIPNLSRPGFDSSWEPRSCF